MSDLHNLKRVLMDLPESERKRIATQAGILNIESILDEAIDREEKNKRTLIGRYRETEGEKFENTSVNPGTKLVYRIKETT